jgi:hypothetical protein
VSSISAYSTHEKTAAQEGGHSLPMGVGLHLAGCVALPAMQVYALGLFWACSCM